MKAEGIPSDRVDTIDVEGVYPHQFLVTKRTFGCRCEFVRYISCMCCLPVAIGSSMQVWQFEMHCRSRSLVHAEDPDINNRQALELCSGCRAAASLCFASKHSQPAVRTALRSQIRSHACESCVCQQSLGDCVTPRLLRTTLFQRRKMQRMTSTDLPSTTAWESPDSSVCNGPQLASIKNRVDFCHLCGRV